MANNKVNFYLGMSEEEYNLALTYLKLEESVIDIRALGPMSSSDFIGNDMNAWVIVYSAPNELGWKLAKLMGQPGIDLNKMSKDYLIN